MLMRLSEEKSGCAYICTHMDDFNIINTYPEMWIERILAVFLVKSHGPRVYYLGNDYQFHYAANAWTSGTTTYAKEAFVLSVIILLGAPCSMIVSS